jgi:hypothetical protein
MISENTLELEREFTEEYSDHANMWDYALVFLLIATSGMEFFYFNDEYIAIGLFLSLITFTARRKLEFIDLKFILILLIFILWEIIQSYYFQSYLLKSLLGTFGRFTFAYAVIKNVGKKFIDTYVKIIYFLSIVSLLFYFLFFSPQLTNLVVSHAIRRPLFPQTNLDYGFTPNYIIINFNAYNEFRNSGPFWEPGAFADFLNIALLFNIFKTNKLVNKRNVLFIITIITTLSTAGFVTLFFIISSVYLLLDPSVKKVFILIPLIVVFTVLMMNVPFLLPKIENNVLIADNDNTSRFGSAVSDYYLIYKNPIVGYGRDIENKFNTSLWDEKKMHRNNGVTGFMTEWGLLLFVLYFANYKKSANYICSYFNSNAKLAIIFLISVLLLGFSEGLFQYPFFHSLMFLQFAYNNYT